MIGIIIILCCCYCLYSVSKFIKYYVDYAYEKYVLNEFDYPLNSCDYNHIFNESMSAPCHFTAKNIFSILTGIKIDCMNILGFIPTNCNFDDSSHENIVSYIEFSWCDKNTKFGEPISLFHALVYHNGYVFQSYRTKRHNRTWFSFTDAYPMIRFPIKKSDRHLFETDIHNFSVKDFNRFCAPSTHPIPINSNLRCQRLYKAIINPARENIQLTFCME